MSRSRKQRIKSGAKDFRVVRSQRGAQRQRVLRDVRDGIGNYEEHGFGRENCVLNLLKTGDLYGRCLWAGRKDSRSGQARQNKGWLTTVGGIDRGSRRMGTITSPKTDYWVQRRGLD